MTDQEKIKFMDTLLAKLEEYIEEDANEDMRPLEFDDEDDKGNTVRRYFPTTFQYRKECSVEDLCMRAEDLTPFAYDMFEWLGYQICGASVKQGNIFAE